MTTDLVEEMKTEAIPESAPADLKEELESLLEIIKKKVDRTNMTPCASCSILVPITSNECPHCNSNIAPHNALMRESLRRITEIRAELDGDHRKHLETQSRREANVGFFGRIKRFFSGSTPQPVVRKQVRVTDGPRILDKISESDQLTVVEQDYPWYRIKTRDGREGWVYSTLKIES